VGNVSRPRLAWVIAAMAVLMAGCGGPPSGLEDQWRRMMDARHQYEMCTDERYRRISACDAALAAYRAEQARYHAALEAKATTIAH
jgi:hypothetical protein